MGTGMEETYQLTSALKYLPHGETIALITDARFSGVSTGACIGHVGPEALAGGPLGKLRDGDMVQIVIDLASFSGSVDLIADNDAAKGSQLLDSPIASSRSEAEILNCRRIRARGRRCKTSAAVRGAGVCMMRRRSLKSWGRSPEFGRFAPDFFNGLTGAANSVTIAPTIIGTAIPSSPPQSVVAAKDHSARGIRIK